jgi:urease accessory protein
MPAMLELIGAAREGGREATPRNLLVLLTFMSPAFPIGSFSYSHGLEWLIDSGVLWSADALADWASDLLELGSGWNDAVLFTEAYRATADGDIKRLLAAAELGECLAAGRERHLETMAQGAAFTAALLTAWPCPAAVRLQEEGGAPYPVAVAAAAAEHALPLDHALPAYLNAFAANLVSVAVRLVPLGQSTGLRILAGLHPVIATVADRAAGSSLDDLGSATMLSDVAAMRHEEQYSRIFRS